MFRRHGARRTRRHLEQQFHRGRVWAKVFRERNSEYVVRVQKRFCDGRWKSTTYYLPEELRDLVDVATRALRYVEHRRLGGEVEAGNRMPRIPRGSWQ